MPICTDCDPIIGVWAQPVEKFQQWKDCGINTIFSPDTQGGRYTQAYVRQKCAELGLKYVDKPSANIAADHADPNLLAFLLPDEPDYRVKPVSEWSTPYNAIRAVSNKPCFGNFSGPHVTAGFPLYDGKPNATWPGHRAFMPYVDWLSHDWYPINTDPARYWDAFNGPGLILRAMDCLKSWSNGKPQLAFVECGDINKSAKGRVPTPDEMETIVKAIWNHPSSLGYIFFTCRDAGDRGGGAGYKSFSFDTTTPDMRTRMTQVNLGLKPAPTPKKPKYILYDDYTWADA